MFVGHFSREKFPQQTRPNILIRNVKLLNNVPLYKQIYISLKLASCESSVFFFAKRKKTTRRNSTWGEMGGTSPQKESNALLLAKKTRKIVS